MEEIKNDIQRFVREVSKCITSEKDNPGWTELYLRTESKLQELKEKAQGRDDMFFNTFIELCAIRTIIEIFKEKEKS